MFAPHKTKKESFPYEAQDSGSIPVSCFWLYQPVQCSDQGVKLRFPGCDAEQDTNKTRARS
jgi:hypothetical protein